MAKVAGVCMLIVVILTWNMGFEWSGIQKFHLLCAASIGGCMIFLGFWMNRGH